MALRQCCDVFGTATGVKKYRICIEVEVKPSIWERVSGVEAWYCPRGFNRAVRFLDRALHPPCVRKETSDSS